MDISNVTHDSADLEWKSPNSDGGTPLTNYLIEAKTADSTVWSKCGVVAPDVTKYTAVNLLENTEYLFRVIAINAEGCSEPLEATDTTIPRKKIGEFL